MIPARGPPIRTRTLRARSALAAPRPGPRGPGPGSSSRADVAGSGRSWARLALQSSGRRGLQTLRSPTSSPTRQPDAHGLLLAAPRRHCARRSVRPRGPLRCRRRGHVAAPAGGPRSNRRVDAGCGHGDMGGGGGRCAPSLARPMGHPFAQQTMASSRIAVTAQQVPPKEPSVPSPLCHGPARVPTGLKASMVASPGEPDRDLAGRQFSRNCLPIQYYRVLNIINLKCMIDAGEWTRD